MAPPNDPPNSIINALNTEPLDLLPRKPLDSTCFDLFQGILRAKDVPILLDVPQNVTFTPFSSLSISSDAPLPILLRVQANAHKGGFVGFTQESPSDRLINSLGRFNGRDSLSVFWFKTWWSTQWVGKSGSDLQPETQWVMLNVPEIRSFVAVIPIIEGSFRASLNPGEDGHVLICAESGSTQVKESSFNAIAYVHVCDNPYNLMKEAFSALRVHLNTFKLLEEKKLPRIIDKFGWCTWDACYLTVNPASVWKGVKEFADGGISPRFIIIDDGWQSINFDGDDPNQDAKNLILGGEQMMARLRTFEEGEKFRKYKGGTFLVSDASNFDPNRPNAIKEKNKLVQSGSKDLDNLDAKIKKLSQELQEMLDEAYQDEKEEPSGSRDVSESGMKAFARDLRSRFNGLDDIYVWHALCGAWGGVRPETTELKCKVVPCKLSPGLDGTMPDLAVDKIVEGGIGLVHPSQAHELYDSMHSYLASAGVTGVKVDVIHALEYVSEENGGRVELAKAYYNGLTKSMIKNLSGTELISSMQQCNDFFYLGTKQVSFGRVGDDFCFQDPNGDPEGVYWLQGVHMIHCSYNSLWMGQMIQPDWDMFQSDHVCAKYHVASRAICGGPIYLSDCLGSHDFGLIKQLVFPDVTIPRCLHYALPARDSLFKNPLFDKESVLKIFNFNMFGGVIRAFNCQGAGWNAKEHRIIGYKECYKPVFGTIHISDIEWDQNPTAKSQINNVGEYLVYMNQSDKILFMNPKSDPIKITLQPSSFELFSFMPVKKFPNLGVKFAPIGLINMFNCVGTIRDMEYIGDNIMIQLKGEGKYLAYCSSTPKKCCLNGAEVGFKWEVETGRLSLNIPWVEEVDGISDLSFIF